MKIALGQLNYHIGNFSANSEKIISGIRKAKSEGCKLIVFSELALSGYPARDFLNFTDFIENCETSIEKIAQECYGITAIVGAPSFNNSKLGKNTFNSAFVLQEGEVKRKYNKWLLPTYDVFDEYRYFEPSEKGLIFDLENKRICVSICEDIWDIEEDKLYANDPFSVVNDEEIDLIINLSASPFSYNHYESRLMVARHHAKKHNCDLVYVNHVGAQTELTFDGGSFVVNSEGNLIHQSPFFEEDISVFDTEVRDVCPSIVISKYERIHDALILGIKDYFTKLGFKKAILGLSGGVDSALVAYLASRALGAENLLCVLMPSEYSTSHSVSDAEELVRNLKCKQKIIEIHAVYEQFLELLNPHFEEIPFNVTEENLQARSRGVILMGLSNKLGHILLNTTNKSEMAVGYGTLYGDMCGGLSPIGDLYKTEVFDLCRYINRNETVIPWNIIEKPPSAELRPDQKDSDSLPPYEVLDEILYKYINEELSPQDIIDQNHDYELVMRILKMVNRSEYKRHQTAPILRMSNKSFGMGRRMPIVGHYLEK